MDSVLIFFPVVFCLLMMYFMSFVVSFACFFIVGVLLLYLMLMRQCACVFGELFFYFGFCFDVFRS